MNIRWSAPYSVREGFTTKWRREWAIPANMVDGFFIFWRQNRFKMLSEGFTVTKTVLTGKWILYETKDDIALFHEFGTSEKKDIVTTPTIILPDYRLLQADGLRPWQVGAAEKMVAAINHWGAAIDGSDLGCHAKGQGILMADGNIKKVENIIVGDMIMGWKGPQMVTKLHRGHQQMVKIIPVKGNPFVVNLNHILTVVVTGGGKSHKTTGGYTRGSIIDIQIKDFLKLSKTSQSSLKLFTSKVDSWTHKNVPFSPYFIGSLLGDGGLSSKSMVTFTSTDPEQWNAIKGECNLHGWTLGNTSELITKRITNSPDLFKWLRINNLFPVACESRYIPLKYKTGSRAQRLELLAGIIDSDGSYYKNGNGYEITLKSKLLTEDIVFIARSLGLSAYFSPCKKTCCNNGVIGDYFRTHISGQVNIIPCRLSRKQASARTQIKDPLRTGFTIELLPEDDYYGFSLDGDGRFLSDNFVVFHNTGKTYSSCGVVRELDIPFVIVCPKPVIYQWEKVINNHFHLDKLRGIINYELLIRGRKDSDIASYVLSRETRRKKFVWKLPKNSIIVWDEAHRLKNWSTKASKSCIEAHKQGYKQLFLSATLASSPLDLRTVGVCTKLFKTAQEYYDWAYAHGVYKGQWGLKFNNSSAALKKIHRYLFEERGVRLLRDIIPNFPETEIIVNAYNIAEEDAAKIREIYDEMKLEIARIKVKEKADESEMAIRIHALQRTEMLKIPLIEEMIREGFEAGMSVVVFLNYSDSIDALAKRMNTQCIYDGRNEQIRQRYIELFQSNKEPLLITNLAAAREGLNLGDEHGGHPRMALITPNDSVQKLKQVFGRVHRENSKTKSIQKLIYVANTQEEDVVENVGQKMENLTLINNGSITDDDLKI